MPTKTFPHCFAALAIILLLVGCDRQEKNRGGESSQNGGKQLSKATGLQTEVVKGIKYDERIELPGASVHGLETTKLMAKVAGYVKTIGVVRESSDEPKRLEIVKAASEQPENDEIDFGSVVEADTVLAVLDIPEMQDEIDEAQAHIDEANSEVDQQTAAVNEAKSKVNQRRAEVKQAKAKRSEKTAKVNYQKSLLRNIERLVNEEKAIGRERLDESKYAMAAATAALKSVDSDVIAADAAVAAAVANVAKANADKLRAIARVKVAVAAAKRLTTKTRYATIRAPYKGIITERLVDHGSFVRPATSNSNASPLFEITRIDWVRIVVNVPSKKAGTVQKGQKIEFHNIGGLPGVVIPAMVSRTGLARNSMSRMMRIDVYVKNPARRKGSRKEVELLPGLFGTVRVIVKNWKALPEVPASAVATDENGQRYVVVVESGEKLVRRDIETVFAFSKRVGIREGVKIGEVVVTKDLDKLKNVHYNSAESH